jgi:hypothetical protein
MVRRTMDKVEFETKVEELSTKLNELIIEGITDEEESMVIAFCALEIVVSTMFSMIQKEKLDLSLKAFCEKVKLNILGD